MLRALALALALALAPLPAHAQRDGPKFLVHALSAAHRRPAAWARTGCGSVVPLGGNVSDIPTQWGRLVTPDNAWREYPRPQMARDAASTFVSLSGLWEFELAAGHIDAQMSGVFDSKLPFGRTLNQTILVPFPLEACLSGAFAWPLYSYFLFYRLLFDAPFPDGASRTLLHFGAVDWRVSRLAPAFRACFAQLQRRRRHSPRAALPPPFAGTRPCS
jgi:hypothetical protein